MFRHFPCNIGTSDCPERAAAVRPWVWVAWRRIDDLQDFGGCALLPSGPTFRAGSYRDRGAQMSATPANTLANPEQRSPISNVSLPSVRLNLPKRAGMACPDVAVFLNLRSADLASPACGAVGSCVGYTDLVLLLTECVIIISHM